jgi:hypothetical protein
MVAYTTQFFQGEAVFDQTTTVLLTAVLLAFDKFAREKGWY